MPSRVVCRNLVLAELVYISPFKAMNTSGIWNKVYIGFTLTLTGFVVNQKRFLISQSSFSLHSLPDSAIITATFSRDYGLIYI